MRPHPLVEQLRFARSEWQRDLEGVSEEDAVRRLLPMNSIGWMVGHLAWHEQLYWLRRAQDLHPLPALDAVANGAPGSTPSMAAMWTAWDGVLAVADPWLDALTTADMPRRMIVDRREWHADIGTMIRRVTYHYWCHIGEGTMGPYRPESPV